VFSRKATAQQHAELIREKRRGQPAQPCDHQCITRHRLVQSSGQGYNPSLLSLPSQLAIPGNCKMLARILKKKGKKEGVIVFQAVGRKSGPRDTTHSVKKS